MRAELTLLADELRVLLPGTQPFLLPMPYTRGHFRIFSQEDLPKTPDFTAVRRGGNLFVTVEGENGQISKLILEGPAEVLNTYEI